MTRQERYDAVSFLPDAKLPWLDRLAYGAGSAAGANISWVAFGYYLMYFYTDVVGLSGTVAGTLILGSRIWDCITDMIMGWAVDRFNLKWGKYRSWVIISLIPMTVLFIGVFTVMPGLGPTGKLIWAILTYGNFGAIGATLCFIPMSAQIMNISKNVEERSLLVGIKMAFASAATILVSAGFMPMVKTFSPKDAAGPGLAGGFFITALILAAITFLLLGSLIIITKRYELNADGSYREHLRIARKIRTEPVLMQVKRVLGNKPVVILMAGLFVQYILQAVRQGMVVYIFNYYFNLADFLSKAMFANTLLMVVGAILLKPVIHLLKDSNRAYKTTMVLSVILNIVFWAVCVGMGPERGAISIQFKLLFFIFALNGLLTGMHISFTAVLLPNCVEYGAWKNKKFQPGMMYSFDALCLTFGSAFGMLAMGICLDTSGYVADQAQSPDTLSKLLFLAFMVPAILTAVQCAIQLFFPLTDKMCAGYAKENIKRLEEEADAGTAPESEE